MTTKKTTTSPEVSNEEIVKLFSQLNTRLDKIEADVTEVKELKTKPVVQTPVLPSAQDDSPHPVPAEYKRVVRETLNQAFGVRVEAMADRPQFQFTIIVPPKYSRATPEQLSSIGGHDIRPRVLDYALGLNGVKLWAEKVYNSFSPEIQALIVADRNLSTV